MLDTQRHGQEKIHRHKSVTIADKVFPIIILHHYKFCFFLRFVVRANHSYAHVAVSIRDIYLIGLSCLLVESSCCLALRSCARPSIGRSLYALLIKDIINFQRNPLYVR
jgi:hypothetical protein